MTDEMIQNLTSPSDLVLLANTSVHIGKVAMGVVFLSDNMGGLVGAIPDRDGVGCMLASLTCRVVGARYPRSASL
jgi:hypothetical protein